MPFQAREVAFKLKLKDGQINQFVERCLLRIISLKTLLLFEINPLSVRENGDIMCGCQSGDDSNALYRLPEIAAH